LKKIILCEGDSWTSGDIINPKLDVTWVNHPTNDSYRLPKVWPHKLGELLNIEVLNTANAGCSNDSIVRRVVENTLKLLDKYRGEEIFVIVGWSSPERKDFYYDYNGKKYWETFHPFAITDPQQLSQKPKDQQEFYKAYIKYYWNKGEYFSRYMHNNLYLHYFLKSNNIDHLFFDAFYQTNLGNYHTIEMRKQSAITKSKFLKLTKDIYKDISFKNFILEGKHFCEDNLHPNEKGHQLWAEELSKDLQWIK
tara:strand:- start:124 stop:876 length:753 start_codon:yes stop_codon:yes gene_type:complete